MWLAWLHPIGGGCGWQSLRFVQPRVAKRALEVALEEVGGDLVSARFASANRVALTMVLLDVVNKALWPQVGAVSQCCASKLSTAGGA